MSARRVSLAVVGAAVVAAATVPAGSGLPGVRGPVATVPPRESVSSSVPAGRVRLVSFLVPPAVVPPAVVPPAVVPPPAAMAPDPATPSVADERAGILRRSVARSAGGTFDAAPGSVPAPGPGDVRTVRVEVERALPVDRDRFATFVLATLNDPRGWGHGGAMSFARTDGDAPIVVALASPDTSARLCAGRDRSDTLSCRVGPHAVLNFQRWVAGTDEYAGNLTGYRQYLVNHEVGHGLGHGHERCPGPGRPAPVMQQQTLGLKGCAQNSWPYP